MGLHHHDASDDVVTKLVTVVVAGSTVVDAVVSVEDPGVSVVFASEVDAEDEDSADVAGSVDDVPNSDVVLVEGMASVETIVDAAERTDVIELVDVTDTVESVDVELLLAYVTIEFVVEPGVFVVGFVTDVMELTCGVTGVDADDELDPDVFCV